MRVLSERLWVRIPSRGPNLWYNAIMSVENHPNLHAVGLTLDISNALIHRVRGEAAEVPFAEILKTLEQEIQDFVVGISIKLDKAFPKVVT